MFRSNLRNNSAPITTLFLVGAAIVCFAGCNSQPTRNPGIETIPVQAKVTYQGNPVEGAIVSFTSTESQRSATGMTDAAGVALITTFDYGDGAIPGNHEVKIAKDIMETLKEADPDDPTSAAVVRPKHLLPQRYNNFKTSGLTATVTKETKQLEFELKD